MSKPGIPIIMGSPTIANEARRRTGFTFLVTPCPATHMCCYESSVTGMRKSVQFHHLVSSVVRHVKGSKGHLNQRINCYASNAGTSFDSLLGRLADSQCQSLGQRNRSSRWSNDHPGRTGKPFTGRRVSSLITLHHIPKRTDLAPYHGEIHAQRG